MRRRSSSNPKPNTRVTPRSNPITIRSCGSQTNTETVTPANIPAPPSRAITRLPHRSSTGFATQPNRTAATRTTGVRMKVTMKAVPKARVAYPTPLNHSTAISSLHWNVMRHCAQTIYHALDDLVEIDRWFEPDECANLRDVEIGRASCRERV